MPIELPPKKLLPRGFVPQGGVPYPVGDGDDWKNVAARNGLDVAKLIDFNYHTNNTAEVNWYLHHFAKCDKTTKDGLNYIFSSHKPSTIIYLYPRTANFSAEVITTGPGGANQLAQALDKFGEAPSERTEKLVFALDLAEITHFALGVAGLHLGFAGLSMEVLAPFAAELAIFLAIGAGYGEATEKLKRDHFLYGFAIGVVVGANRESFSYLSSNFRINYPVDVNYLPIKNIQNYDNAGLAVGYEYGKKLNLTESSALFHQLNLAMFPHRYNPELTYGVDYWEHLRGAERKDYYENAARSLRGLYLPKD